MRPIAWTLPRHPIRWNGWRRGLTSSCTQRSTPSWGRTGTVDSPAILLSPEHGYRSWRYGKAGGSEVPHAHTSCPVTRNGATQPLERSERTVDGSGLPQSSRGGRVHRNDDCRNRSCDPAASGEVSESSLCRLRDSNHPGQCCALGRSRCSDPEIARRAAHQGVHRLSDYPATSGLDPSRLKERQEPRSGRLSLSWVSLGRVGPRRERIPPHNPKVAGSNPGCAIKRRASARAATVTFRNEVVVPERPGRVRQIGATPSFRRHLG